MENKKEMSKEYTEFLKTGNYSAKLGPYKTSEEASSKLMEIASNREPQIDMNVEVVTQGPNEYYVQVDIKKSKFYSDNSGFGGKGGK